MTRSAAANITNSNNSKRSISSSHRGRNNSRSSSSRRRRAKQQLHEEDEDDDELLLDEEEEEDNETFGEDAMDMLSNTFSQLANMTSDFFAGRSMTPTDFQQAHVIPDLDHVYRTSSFDHNNKKNGRDDDDDDDELSDDYSNPRPTRGRSSSARHVVGGGGLGGGRKQDDGDLEGSRRSTRSTYSTASSSARQQQQQQASSSSRNSSRNSSRSSSRNSSRHSSSRSVSSRNSSSSSRNSSSSSRNSSPVRSVRSINSRRRSTTSTLLHHHDEQQQPTTSSNNNSGVNQTEGPVNIKQPFAKTTTTAPPSAGTKSFSRRLSRSKGSGLSSSVGGEDSLLSFLSSSVDAVAGASSEMTSHSSSWIAKSSADALIQEKHDKWLRMQQKEMSKSSSGVATTRHGKNNMTTKKNKKRSNNKTTRKKKKGRSRRQKKKEIVSDTNSSTAGGTQQVCAIVPDPSHATSVRLLQGLLESTTNTCGAMVTGEPLSDDDDDEIEDDSLLEDMEEEEERTITTAPDESLSMESSFTTDEGMVQEDVGEEDDDSWTAHHLSFDKEQQQQQQRDRSTTPNSKRGRLANQEQRQQPSPHHHHHHSIMPPNNNSKSALERAFSSGATSEVSSSFQDKNFIKEFIAQTSQEGLAFTWHQTHPDIAPIEVLVFLEVGHLQASTGCHTGPRLAWYSNSHLQENSPDTLEGALDLLDISHAERGGDGNNNSDPSSSFKNLQSYFPYCRLEQAVLLRLPNQALFCLEARSTEEAKRFIHGLRWVVARLAFNLIIGNPVIACELLDIPEEPDTSMLAGNSGGIGDTDNMMMLYSQEDVAMNDITNELVDKTLLVNVAPKLV